MQNSFVQTLVADTPLSDPKDDRLGFTPFAENLSNAISKIETDECMVFALFGPWGSGKTTCLNFVKFFIDHLPEEKRPIVIEFNPWWFSGRGELLEQFLRDFSVALGKKGEFKQVVGFIANLFEAASEMPGSKTAAYLLNQVSKEKSVAKIKVEIKKNLGKGKNRFLIIIDDIDRLTYEEIRSLFCVIKAIADFPKTAYLLTFDRSIVVKALSQLQENIGEDYMEKIVQVPFTLPTPDKSMLNKLFTDRLEAIFSGPDAGLIDKTYWGNIFLGGIEYFIDTVRNIKRLTNTLKVSYPAVKGEVNPIDFIAIEAIRIFRPETYDLIRANPDMFTGDVELPHLGGDSIEKIKPFYDKWLGNVPEEERTILKDLLIRMFPKLEAVYKNTFYRSDYLPSWRKQLRICSPDIFPIYFRLALPEGQISSNEMTSILALAGNKDLFEKKLIQLSQQIRPDGSTRVREVLERLQDYTEKDIPREYMPSILRALFSIGDKLLLEADEGKGYFGLGNDIRIGQLIHQLIRRYDNQKDRYEVLKEVFSEGKAVEMIVHEVEILGQQQGKYGSEMRPQNDWIINSEQLKELEYIALSKIVDAASKSELMQKPRAIQILYRWRDWQDNEAVNKYVAGIIASDEGLASFLSLFLVRSSSWGLDDRVPRVQWRLDPKWIKPFAKDLSEIERRSKNILKENPVWLKEKGKTALETFVRSYDLVSKGKDIDNE